MLCTDKADLWKVEVIFFQTYVPGRVLLKQKFAKLPIHHIENHFTKVTNK